MGKGRFENVDRAIDWIHGARYKGQKNGLENTYALLSMLDDPQNSFKSIHVAGTNGKGSTCAFCSRALIEAGYTVGLYTSPYLIKYNERVQVSGVPISDDDLLEITELIAEKTDILVEKGIFPTTFEIGTAIAFEYFRRKKVDYAVIEVGLGGRFDSTNVITPVVSAIAAIGLDHTKTLGNTIPEIAFEKAGIIKKNIPCVAMDQSDDALDVFRKAAFERNSFLTITDAPEIIEINAYGARFVYKGEEYKINLCGAHQVKNACLAIDTLKTIGIPSGAIRSGLEKTKWPCRLEWVDKILIDGAHNPHGAQALDDYMKTYFSGKKITLVTGMMKDKNIDECAKIMSGFADNIIATAVKEERAETPENIKAIYESYNKSAVCAADVKTAIEMAKRTDSIIVCAGSLYIAGEVRMLLKGNDCF